MQPSVVLRDYVATKIDRLESFGAEILAIYIVILRNEGAAAGGAYSVKALAVVSGPDIHVHCALSRPERWGVSCIVVSGPDIHVHCAGDEPRAAIDRVSATLAAQFRKRRLFLRKRRRQILDAEGVR